MNIIEIKDFSDPNLDVYARNNESQLLHYYEPKLGLFVAESPNVILRALQAGYEAKSVLCEKRYLEGETKDLVEALGNVPVYVADIEVLKQLTGFELTRGLLCAMRRKELPDVKQLIQDKRRIVILEDVVNPTNVGAIFRSAAALNMDAVILTKPCADPLYRRASRVSMGTVFQIPWTYFNTDWPSEEGRKLLETCGYKTVAMALREDSYSIRDPRIKAEEKLAIVMGTEGVGLQQETIDCCDYTVCIPMSHQVDSLNVAAASAVAFWELGENIT